MIHKLYQENSQLVTQKVSEICSCRNDESKYYSAIRLARINGNTGLVFRVTHCGSCHDIFVGDFEKYREITIDELKDMLSKYEQLETAIEKLTEETHIVY